MTAPKVIKGGALVGRRPILLDTALTIIAIVLMVITPGFVLALWYTCRHLNGSYLALFEFIAQHGVVDAYKQLIQVPDTTTWKILLTYFLGQAAIMKAVPGKRFTGPLSPMGNTPVYKAHGLQCYAVSLALYAVLYYNGVFTGQLIYEQMGKLYCALVISAFIFCVFMWIKGHVAPTDEDSGSSGNPVMDFYWGMELYPHIFGFNVKHYISCRVSMTAWPLLLISYALAEYEAVGYVSSGMMICVGIQLVYLTKFFYWETGYLCTLDIIHDRFGLVGSAWAGYYICWGFLCWVPSLYTSSALFLVNHQLDIAPWKTAVMIAFGVLCTYLNWQVDEEKIQFRKSKGQAPIWGKKPEYIVATYQAPNGKKSTSLLLASGWWGTSRHVNYLFELLATYTWAPLIQFEYLMPFSYSIFLTILLLHRIARDEERCHLKYGKPYEEYCRRVPYRLIPGVI